MPKAKRALHRAVTRLGQMGEEADWSEEMQEPLLANLQDRKQKAAHDAGSNP